MKTFILVSLLGLSTALANTTELAHIKKIECENIQHNGDHHTITPNVYSRGDKNFAAVSGYYTINNGTGIGGDYRQDRQDFFYEVRISKIETGATRIQLFNDNTQFQNNREMNLFTNDFKTGTLQWHVFQPGIAGYGPGGIPQSNVADLVYDCQFIE